MKILIKLASQVIMAHQFNDASSSDFLIVLPDSQLYTHKLILQRHSTYFRTLFRRKQCTNPVDIMVVGGVLAENLTDYVAVIRWMYDPLDIQPWTLDSVTRTGLARRLRIADRYAIHTLSKVILRFLSQQSDAHAHAHVHAHVHADTDVDTDVDADVDADAEAETTLM